MRRAGASAGLARATWMALGALLVLGLGSVPAMAKGGYLGVHLQDVDALLLEAFDLDGRETGVLITEVMDDSPAEAAGLKRGDLVVALDGDAVEDASALTRAIRRMDPGDSVEISFLRKGEPETVTVDLAERERARSRGRSFWSERDDDDPGAFDFRVFSSRGYLGVRVEPVGEDLGRYFDTDTGLLVLEVFEGSAAEEAGMRAGDVILEVDGTEVTETADIFAALDDADDGDRADVVVVRDGSRETLTVEIQDSPVFSRHFNQLPRMFHHRGLGEDGNTFFFRPDQPRVRTRLRGLDRDGLRERMEELQEQMEELREELEDLRGEG